MSKKRFLAVPAAMMIALGTVGVGFQGVAQAAAPGAPTNVTVTPGNGLLLVSWTAPANNGGSPITDYDATVVGGLQTCNTTATPPAVPSTQCTITGLTNGTAYSVTVTATNEDPETSDPSAPSAPAIPFTLPSAPQTPGATPGNGAATVTWTAPADDGGFDVLSYTATSTPGGRTCTVAAPALTCDVTGLNNGTAYTFTIIATTEKGNSPASAPTPVVTPQSTVPGPPTGVTATAGDEEATVSWTAPANVGATALTGYKISRSVNGGAFSAGVSTGSLNTTATVTGLNNGDTYVFRVLAVNSTAPNDGAWSAPSGPVTPSAVPAALTPTATPGPAQVRLTWVAPASDSPIQTYQARYRVTAGPGAWTAPVTLGPTTLAYTFSGLTNSTNYGFQVRAGNATGYADWADANIALATPLSALPAAPTISQATPGNGQVTLTGTAASGATNFTVYVDGVANPAVCTQSGSAFTCPVTGLANGVTYSFTLTVTTTGGTSLPSAAVPATPRRAPLAPTGVTAVAGNASATVTWLAADNGGSVITGYTVTSSPGNLTCTTSSLSCTVTGLTPNTSYTFTVTATNAAGTSPASNASNPVTPTAGVPLAPSSVAGTPGNGQVALTWTAPGNGGSAITNYRVRFSTNNGASWSTPVATGSTAASFTVTGLTNTTSYVFQVLAVNAFGDGAWSAASAPLTPTTATVPGAPTGVTATAGNAQATVSWAAPANNGGSTITGYTVTSQSALLGTPVRTCTTTGATTCTVTGLTNGVTYTFSVTATNSSGTGASSASSNAVTPGLVPGAPTAVTATAGDAKATVSWTAPTNTGGAAITGYTVTSSPGARTCTTTGATTCEVTGLTNGTTYTFTVVARNAIGTGPASAASNAVTPRGTNMTITIVGSRGTGSEANMVFVDGITEGLVGKTVTPYFRFPGQSGFTAGTGTRTVDANGDFAWQRKTGKRIVVEFRGDGITSNRVVIQAK